MKHITKIVENSTFTHWVTLDGVATNVEAVIHCNDGERTSFSYVSPHDNRTVCFRCYPNDYVLKLINGVN